jgi:hypothetical protein
MRILNLPVNFVKISIGSTRSLLLAVAVVSLIAIILAGSIFVVKRSSAHGVNSAKKTPKGCCSDQPAVPRRMIGTYYTTEAGFQSTLILNNKGPNLIMVTPILHSQSGQTFTAPPVAVGGHSSPEVDLNLLASMAGPRFRFGSFEFTYEGRLLEVGGGLRIISAEKSLIFDEQMLEPGMKFPSSRLETVYAIPFEDSHVGVIVTNTTAQPIIVNGDAVFAEANVHYPLQSRLGPYETQIVNLPQGLIKKASAGAVSLNHNGDKGALLAMIHLWDADRGYSDSVNFTNPSGKTTERHGAGLRLGSVGNDPLRALIAVRNIGDSETTVTATVPYSKQDGNTGTIELPRVSIEPGEIKLLNTTNRQLRRNDFATAGLEIKYTGEPGSVIATASSVSQSGDHVFALPMKDPKGGLSSTGGYPWFINETSSTVVFIKNTTDKPQNFILSIIYPGGTWELIHPAIPASQTVAIDMRKLRDSQQKGVGDNVIPLYATSGHISWGARGTAEKVLIGRAQTADIAKGMASTYECQCQCVPSWTGRTRVSPQNPTLFVGEQTSIGPETEYADCFGGNIRWFQVNAFDLSGSSNNPSVVAYSSFTATALNPGSATITFRWTEQIVNTICPGPDIECPVPPEPCPCSCEAFFPDAIASTNVTAQGPTVTIASSLLIVPKNETTDVEVTVSPSNNTVPIQLRITRQSGTGEARFNSNNATTLNITNSSRVTLKGITESNTKDNMTLEAYLNDTLLSFRKFSVVWVVLSLRTSGEISSDNDSKSRFNDLLGSTILGTFRSSGTNPNKIWRTAVELAGAVTPNNLTESVTLRRTIVDLQCFNGSTAFTCAQSPGADDTSDLVLLDFNPQSGDSMGKVYDLDAPGIGSGSTTPLSSILRQRVNFKQYATIDGYQGTDFKPIKCSSDFEWFTRISVIKTSGDIPRDSLSTGITGDNTAGTGRTATTWNLQ